MKLENQVVSLSLSKQLKEAGYPQEGLFWWAKFNWKLKFIKDSPKEKDKYLVAPSCGVGGEIAITHRIDSPKRLSLENCL